MIRSDFDGYSVRIEDYLRGLLEKGVVGNGATEG